MAIQTYNFPTHKRGTTFNGVQFELKINGTARDLTGSKITMVLDGNNEAFSTVTGEIIFSDAANGKFQFKKQVVNISPKNHSYEMQFVFGDGEEKVYLSGYWKIV